MGTAFRRGAVQGFKLSLLILSLPGALAVGKIIGTLLGIRHQGFYLHD